jgi:hypothetical protein
VNVPLNVTLAWAKLTGESVRVKLVARVLPFGPVKVANVEVFLIPLGCETTNSKATFVFAEIKSRSFGVKEKDSTTGRSLAWATPGANPIINKMAISADLILIFFLL